MEKEVLICEFKEAFLKFLRVDLAEDDYIMNTSFNIKPRDVIYVTYYVMKKLNILFNEKNFTTIPFDVTLSEYINLMIE